MTTPLKLSVILLILFTGGILGVQTASADGPLPDSACRTCHADKQEELTLPSGETLPLHVPMEALNQSPHSPDNQITCTGCHRPRAHYQFPHQPVQVETRRQFAQQVSERCQSCHTPHSPLHKSDTPNPEFPACAECHGSHQIDRPADILNSMPANCLSCHTGRTEKWAVDLIRPRVGLGQPAEGYVGSSRCFGCHDKKYAAWQDTLHANMIQNPNDKPGVIVGNFNILDPDLTFGRDDVAYTIGSKWKQRYLTQSEDGNFYVLPAQWNVATAEWVPYNADTWQDKEWRQSCGGCHVTGLNTKTWGFVEFGIGCEACHGPGEAHADDPKNVKPFKEVDDQVCGACHSRGTSPDGLAFPATYRPGDSLTDHFTFTTDDSAVWPDGSAKKHHQQYMDWQSDSRMPQSETTACVSCHSPHSNGIGQTQLKAPLNQLCQNCHFDKQAIIKHTPYHDKATGKRDFLCTDCHMPKMATSAVPYDIHNHSFTQPNPQASLEHGGAEAMPNACNTCHTRPGEGPEWAAQTIEYVQRTIVSNASAPAFGPGPTPTSPPPPTPISSAGQYPVPDTQFEAWGWLRALIFLGVAAIIAGLVYLIFRSIQSRRAANV